MRLPSSTDVATIRRILAGSAVALVLLGLASGCAQTAVPYERPAVTVPSSWQGGAGAQAAWPDREWWKAFRNGELDRLIADAQANNHDLRAAAARVAQARASAQIVSAPLYPTVELAAGAKHARTSNTQKKNSARTYNRYALGLLASYEFDLWGANRLASEAAEDAVLSSTYAQEVVRLTLTADVAGTYFEILSINDRLDVAQRNLANARKLMDLVEMQQKAGRVSPFEVERQRTQVATAEAIIPPLLQQLRVAHDALATLLGLNPGDLKVAAPSLRPLAAPDVPLGLPATLLERRPDIRRAEMDLIAANANVGAARAAVFPTLILGAKAGLKSNVISNLWDPGAGVGSIALDLLATLFDGGRRSGRVDLATGRKAELAEAYQQSIVSGVRDVEDALSGVEQFTAQEKAHGEAVAHAREAYRLAELLFRRGATDFTSVLDAERTLLDAETAADEARLSRFSSIVGLYRALGGGWTPELESAMGAHTSGAHPG